MSETIYARMKAQFDRDLLSKQLSRTPKRIQHAVSNVGVAKASSCRRNRRWTS